MLIIKRSLQTVYIDMDSIESFTFNEAHEDSKELRIKTKSGDSIRVLRPNNEFDEALTFDVIANAILNKFTMWRIVEG